MSRKVKVIIGAIAILFAIVLAIVIPLSLSEKGEKRALALDPTTNVVALPTATTLPLSTETPAFPTPTPAPTPVSTATVIAMTATARAVTAAAVGTRITVPSFVLQAGESKTITIAPEQASTVDFSFESTAVLELQILYGGELVFLTRCTVRRAPGEPARPFTSLVYQPFEASAEKSGAFIFTNGCPDVPSVQVSASYLLTPAESTP